jgi:uncharacterized protein
MLFAAKTKESILRAAQKYGARNVRVFGSVARGEAGPESDIDFLVDFETGRTLMDPGGLLCSLQELLGAHVDVVTERMLKPAVRAKVLRDAIPL